MSSILRRAISSWQTIALLFVILPTDLNAAIVTQNEEIAPAAPNYPRDQMGKPKEAEIILNVNVPDGNNPGKMKSIPVSIKLDPTKVRTPEEKAKAIADAINTNADIVQNNQDLKKNKRGKEQVSASASLDTKHAPLVDRLGRPIPGPNGKPRTVPVMAWQIHTRNTVADNGPGTQPHEAHPVTVIKDDSNEPQHAVFGRPGQRPAGGGTPSPGSPGSMGGKGKTTMGFHPDSTQADPIGSWVTFGYFPNKPDVDAEIFTVYPEPGESDYDVLMELALGLNGLGIPATYDLSINTLTLNVDLASNQGFWFGNTDPGLDLTVSFPMVTTVIPEPATLMFLLLGTGLSAVLGCRARLRSGYGFGKLTNA
jgi:hypothetical protein